MVTNNKLIKVESSDPASFVLAEKKNRQYIFFAIKH